MITLSFIPVLQGVQIDLLFCFVFYTVPFAVECVVYNTHFYNSYEYIVIFYTTFENELFTEQPLSIVYRN